MSVHIYRTDAVVHYDACAKKLDDTRNIIDASDTMATHEEWANAHHEVGNAARLFAAAAYDVESEVRRGAHAQVEDD